MGASARVIVLLALVITLPVMAEAAAGGSETPLEPRGPIHVTSDLDLLLPHRRADNGVRGGTGAPDDPVIISDWRLESAGARAITITNTTLRVVVRDVVVGGGSEARATAIHIEGVQDVTLERVDVPAWEHGVVYAGDSATVSLRNLTVEGGGGSDFSAIQLVRVDDARLHGSRVANRTDNGVSVEASIARIEDSVFEGFPDTMALAGGFSRVTVESSRWTDTRHAIAHYKDAGYRVRNSTFENVTYGVRLTAFSPWQGAGARLIVDGNTFTGPGSGDWFPTAVELNPTRSGHARISQNAIRGFGSGVHLFRTHVVSEENQTLRVTIEGNLIEGTIDGVSEGYDTNLHAVKVFARDNVFRDNLNGYFHRESDATITGNAFVENKRGVIIGGDGSRAHRVVGNDFVANRDYAIRASHAVDAPGNYWGHPDGPTTEWADHVLGGEGDRVTTNVRFEPVLEEPAVLTPEEAAAMMTSLAERARPGFERATTPDAGPALAMGAVAVAAALSRWRAPKPRTPQ